MKKTLNTTDSITAPESNYLYVAISQLPSAGNGLYTAIDIYKDEIIAVMEGELLTRSQAAGRAKKNNDRYFINMPDGSTMDSMNTKCFAKYANDAKGISISGFITNAKIALDENNRVCLIAIRNIKPGEEIFCSYGKRYWRKKMM